MRITGFGTYDRTKHPRTGILLDGLSDLGEDVTEINEPLGFSTAERVAMLGRPWLGYRLVLRLLSCWTRLAGRRLRSRHADVVIVGYLGHFDVILARLLFPRTVIALDLLIFASDTARDRGVRPGLKLALLELLDRVAIACASIVIVDTQEHRSLLRPAQRGKAVVVPVGAPQEWFDARTPGAATIRGSEQSATTRPLRVIFYGLYTPLQGATVIGGAIAEIGKQAAIEFTMVGSGQDLAETKRIAGEHGTVRWLDWVDPDELPALVAGHDVCLGIFGQTPKALRVTPNKVYQGAAAGCAIVTSDTPAQRLAMGDAARLVRPGSAQELAETLSSLQTRPADLTTLRERARRRADEHFRPHQVAEALRRALRQRQQRNTEDR